MADDEVQKILQELDLQDELLEVFSKNKITMKTMSKLNEGMISELIPNIGSRAIFLDYWKNNIMNSKGNVESREDLRKRKHTDDISEDDLINNENISTNVIVATKNLSGLLLKPIKDMLKGSEGKRILKFYENKKELNESVRNKLCNIILNDVQDCTKIFSNKMASEIAQMIVEMFPTEVVTTYYVAPIKKKDSTDNKSHAAKGKLLSIWRNREARFKSLINLKNEDIKTHNDKDNNALLEKGVLDKEIDSSCLWLENNSSPWETVLKHWKKTQSLRQRSLNNLEDKNLRTIFKKWALFKHPKGHELILEDFALMDLTHVKINIELWKSFINIIRMFIDVNKNDNTASELCEQLEKENISDDFYVLKSLHLLAHLIPPKRTLKLSKKIAYKPSIASTKSSMIQCVNDAADIETVRDNATKHAESIKKSLQPMIILVENDHNINSFYVSVDDVLYECQNVLECIDVCFKTFHVFVLQYPVDSEHLWYIIQKGLYNVHTAYDNIIPYVEHVIKKIQKVREVETTSSKEKESKDTDDASAEVNHDDSEIN